MRERFQEIADRLMGQDEDNPTPVGFKGLRLLSANLLLLTGIDAALDAFGRDGGADGPPWPHGSAGPGWLAPGTVAALAPSLLAPLAAAVQARHGAHPSPATTTATRVMSAAVIGAGVAALVGSITRARREGRTPSLTPLALASAGLLGLIVEREERLVAEERRQLQRRAQIVQRLVPRRRAKVDRIVVHV